MKKILFIIFLITGVLLLVVLYMIGAAVHRETGLTEDQVEIFSMKE